MTRKKGLTLLETIIAMALVSIIAAAIMPIFTGYFKMLVNTKKVTTHIYQAQQNTELEINNVRDSVKNGSPPADGQTYTLFTGSYQRTVNGFQREVVINNPPNPVDAKNQKICFVIGDTRMAEYEVAVASNVKIGQYTPSGGVTNAKAITPSLSITATSTITDPHNVNIMNINRWYVSREGFNIPVPASPPEVDIGTKYPKFPDDYNIIPSETASSLSSILAKYGGRHIIYTITPASQSGKMGETVPSSPVFLSGLPVINNLKIHLDASLVDKADTTSVRSSGGIDYVQRWYDMSGSGNNAVQTTYSTRQPQLIEDKFGIIQAANGKKYDTYARYLKFSGGQSMTISDSSSIRPNNMTVFAVIRTVNNDANKSIISKFSSGTTSWALNWDSGNKLGYDYNKAGSSYSVRANTGDGLDKKWHVLMASGDANYSGNLRFGIDDKPVSLAARTLDTNNNTNPITIGWDSTKGYSSIDIAEIVIYSSISDSDIDKVKDYLIEKYRTVP